jgi:hypothetical protein
LPRSLRVHLPSCHSAFKRPRVLAVHAISYLVASLSLVANSSCGSSSRGEECLQVGPQVGYPMQAMDIVIISGFTAAMPNVVDFNVIAGAENYLGLNSATQYPQTCFSSSPTQSNYHFVGWLDNSWYVDGGPPPDQTYCRSVVAPSCQPQQGQPRGQVSVTLYGDQNNIVLIPFSP